MGCWEFLGQLTARRPVWNSQNVQMKSNGIWIVIFLHGGGGRFVVIVIFILLFTVRWTWTWTWTSTVGLTASGGHCWNGSRQQQQQ
mmetsp:Transcript_24755/g.68460  ORF Transcript_24755/g.68460 Transcript_24755/m.68460 type:complete len:86 (+) Transcript_24755:3191-3448(+)